MYRLEHRSDSLPAAPLLEMLRGRNVAELAREAGVPALSVARARERGYVAPFTGDRWAVLLGHHPCELWPREWFV